jgi:TM2 domain-containing membrane protein YozV
MSNILFYITLFLGILGFAQSDPSITVDLNDIIVAQDSVSRVYDANRPAKAAFYSAVIPGLGQIYNKKYWKVPLALAAVGIPIYVYTVNDKEYNRIRDAFRIRLAGGTNDEFSNPDGTPSITTEGLERAQKASQRNKELSILITAALYVLQIIDANVDGHLSQFSVDRNLTFLPYMDYNTLAIGNTYGFNLSYNF